MGRVRFLHVYNAFYSVAVAAVVAVVIAERSTPAPPFPTHRSHPVPLHSEWHQTHDVDGKYYLLFLAAPPNTKIHKENDFLSAF